MLTVVVARRPSTRTSSPIGTQSSAPICPLVARSTTPGLRTAQGRPEPLPRGAAPGGSPPAYRLGGEMLGVDHGDCPRRGVAILAITSRCATRTFGSALRCALHDRGQGTLPSTRVSRFRY